MVQQSIKTRTPYRLTDEQIQFYDENGYLILRNWVPQDLLHKLQAAGDAWIEQMLQATPDDPHMADYNFANRNGSRVPFRINYLHNKGQAASLELLGSPYVLGVAESLCGPNFVPTYESMVFKQKGDGEAIPWHQDAVHPRNHRIFNYDLYLDASRIGAGALRVVPGTHTQKADICRLEDKFGWEPTDVIHAEMEPGDVLLHDVMVVHGSEQVVGKALRRTIYYEFRAAEQIVQEGPWDSEWIDKRVRMLPPALRHYAAAYPEKDQFVWNIADEFRPEVSEDEATELKIAHLVHTSGSFCSAGDVPARKDFKEASN